MDYVLCSWKWRSSIQSAKTKPGADWGSDNELLIAKFRLKLKKVGKTARSFKYDIIQIPNDYTVEVTNRFMGFFLVDGVCEELWIKVCNIVQEAVNKTIPSQKKMQEGKVVVWGDSTNSWGKKRRKRQRKSKRYIQLDAEFQRRARTDKKAFLNDQCKEIKENDRMRKTRDLFKKIGISREYFMQGWAQ